MCRTTVLATILSLTMATAIHAAAPQVINYRGTTNILLGVRLFDANNGATVGTLAQSCGQPMAEDCRKLFF